MVLIFPGEEFTKQVQEDALDLGWEVISSYYQAFRIEDRFCWSQQICSPYLDEFDSKWISSEMPFIGYFHDFDLSRNGLKWFSECIENWKKLGVKNFIDLRTLLIGLNYNLSIKEEKSSMVLHLDNEFISTSDYHFRIKLKSTNKTLPEEIFINKGDKTGCVRLENVKSNLGEFTIPGIF